MPVSSGLQKYFDSKQKKGGKGDLDQKMKELAGQIDPAFMQSFHAFHGRILEIVDGDEDSTEIAYEEISELEDALSARNRQHNLKKASIASQGVQNS